MKSADEKKDTNVEVKDGEKTESTPIEGSVNEDKTVLGSEKKEDDVSIPRIGCYAVEHKQEFACSYCGKRRYNCTQMHRHSCPPLESEMANYVKPEILSEERPTTMITTDKIDYRVGMTFYCRNLCATRLSLSSIKGHYQCCGKTDKEKSPVVRKRKEYYANKLVVINLASENEDSVSESESVEFAYHGPQGDIRSNQEKIDDEEYEDTKEREIKNLRVRNDYLENEVALIKRMVGKQLPMAQKSNYETKFKRLKRTIKGLEKKINNSSTPDTIKTKEKEDLSCITSETQSECIALITAFGAKKIGRSFYHICFYHPFTLLTLLFFTPRLSFKRMR